MQLLMYMYLMQLSAQLRLVSEDVVNKQLTMETDTLSSYIVITLLYTI